MCFRILTKGYAEIVASMTLLTTKPPSLRFWRECDRVYLCRTTEEGQDQHAALSPEGEVVWVDHEPGAVVEPLLERVIERFAGLGKDMDLPRPPT